MEYQIRHHTEKVACTYCACPLEVGDWMLSDDDTHEAFCGKECWQSFAEKNGGVDIGQAEEWWKGGR